MEYKNIQLRRITPLAIFSKLSVIGIPLTVFAYINDKLQIFLIFGLLVYYFTLLLIFSWILVKKPSNLYAPNDFRDDEKFLIALKWANQKTINKRE